MQDHAANFMIEVVLIKRSFSSTFVFFFLFIYFSPL